MPKIIFLPHEEICPDGAVIDAEPGTTICDAALKNHIDIAVAYLSDLKRTVLWKKTDIFDIFNCRLFIQTMILQNILPFIKMFIFNCPFKT